MSTVTRVPIAARLFAAIGWAVTIVGAIGAVTLRIVDPVPIVPNPMGFGDVALVGFVVMGVSFGSVGALLVVRLPRNVIGWAMVLIGVGHTVGVLAGATTSSLVAIGTPAALQTAQLTGWSTTVLVSFGALLLGIGFIFPTGRGHTPRWDVFVRMLVTVATLAVLTIVFQPGPLSVFPTIENAFGYGPDLRMGYETEMPPVAVLSSVIFLPFLLWSLLSRYRLATSIERQQLKWFGLALVVATGALGLSAAGASVGGDAPEIGLAIFGFVGALVPVSIGIAILRYRLYDIDRLISQSITYAAVTGLLFAVFGAVNLGLQATLSGLTGTAPVVVAASTLTAAVLFNPVRTRVQALIDSRFHRARYDAERTVEAFASRLRDELDLTTLTADLCQTADEAVASASTSIWLREPGGAR